MTHTSLLWAGSGQKESVTTHYDTFASAKCPVGWLRPEGAATRQLFSCTAKSRQHLTHYLPCDTMLTEVEAPHTGACRFREMFPEKPPCRVVIYTAAFLLLTLCECEHCENKRGNADDQAQELNVCHCYHLAFFCVFTPEARLPPCKALCLHLSHEHYTV